MGLSVGVGIYENFEDDDDVEGVDHFDHLFAAIAQVMVEAGLPAHVEPKVVKSWSSDGYGYSGLHALREIAAMIWKDLPIPRLPLISGRNDTNLADELFDQAIQTIQPPMPEKPKGLIAQLFGISAKASKPLPPFRHSAIL